MAVININLTQGSLKSSGTFTLKVIEKICACGTIRTWHWGTFIDFFITILSSVSRYTQAGIGVYSIHTLVCVANGTREGVTVINVDVTIRASETCWTFTGVESNIVLCVCVCLWRLWCVGVSICLHRATAWTKFHYKKRKLCNRMILYHIIMKQSCCKLINNLVSAIQKRKFPGNLQKWNYHSSTAVFHVTLQ